MTEYVLPSNLGDSFAIVQSRISETAKAAFETLMWSEAIPDGSDLDDSVVTAVFLAVSDFLGNPGVAAIIDYTSMTPEFLGHNMILSGNRHGAGFWDSIWEGATKEQMDLLHKYSPSVEIYEGDENTWYAY